MTADAVGATFAALADPTRRHVIDMLAELARDLPITRQAVAKHLATLADAGLVTSQRAGRETRYRLTPAPLSDAREWIDNVGAEWDARLSRLARHVKRGS